MRYWRACVLLLLVCLALTAMAGCSKKDSHLATIKQRGTLIVGTSPDYPPWEYMDDKNQYAGFDMDLARMIAEKLGVKLEVRDLSFDALVTAVKEKKIDVAIACMNADPKRAEEVDFSDAYWHIKSGPLVAKDSTLNFAKVADCVKYRVGVQTGTTEENWLNEQVKQGKMKEDQVSHFERNEQAIADLVAGRLDAVLIEEITGREFAKANPVRMTVAEDISGSPTAIAIPKGSDDLKEAINKALKEFKDKGVIDELAKKHLYK
ncbi:MAG: ABC transporter substrate-binding protein [Ignavibacteriales bacterium]